MTHPHPPGATTALLSTTYFGPVQWYQKLYRYPHVLMEHCESFQKQTYRNRCLIATTQGIQALTVPIERGSNPANDDGGKPIHASHIKNIRISDHGNWQQLHWNALCTAYHESPFFDYYQDDLHPFFEHRWTYLLDFNHAICAKICELLDITPAISPTTHYTANPNGSDYIAANKENPAQTTGLIRDFRESIRPKHPAADADFQPQPYYQVYARKHGFQPNLSILDLLCNMGPESIFYL